MTGFQNRSSSILGRALALPSHTRGGSRMRESRTYGSVRGARDEIRVPTATGVRGETAMKLPRRNFLHLATGAAALPAVSHIAWAQTYPTRPVRIVVGFPPGGGADIT